MMATACGLDCERCPAARRCGSACNYCTIAVHNVAPTACAGCGYCRDNPLLVMSARQSVMDYLGGLDLTWPRPVVHPALPVIPSHLPVLVQAYADPVEPAWVAIHGGRLLGTTGRQITSKHRSGLHGAYRLGPKTRIALEFYVEDRVLEGLWVHRREIIEDLKRLDLDLVITPNFSVWYDHPRFEQLVQQRRAFILYHELLEAGLPAIPDVGFSLFEPDGRLWAEWVNAESGIRAVSLFCGGRKVHADRRAHLESVEDIALFDQAVRRDVTFLIGGVHGRDRIADYRRAAPGRRLSFCNGMAYSLAQRRRLLASGYPKVARSARECFLLNCAENDRAYAELLDEAA